MLVSAETTMTETAERLKKSKTKLFPAALEKSQKELCNAKHASECINFQVESLHIFSETFPFTIQE